MLLTNMIQEDSLMQELEVARFTQIARLLNEQDERLKAGVEKDDGLYVNVVLEEEKRIASFTTGVETWGGAALIFSADSAWTNDGQYFETGIENKESNAILIAAGIYRVVAGEIR